MSAEISDCARELGFRMIQAKFHELSVLAKTPLEQEFCPFCEKSLHWTEIRDSGWLKITMVMRISLDLFHWKHGMIIGQDGRTNAWWDRSSHRNQPANRVYSFTQDFQRLGWIQGSMARVVFKNPISDVLWVVGKYFDKQQRWYFWIPAFAAPSSASLWKQGRSWARNDRHKYTDTPLQWYHQISTVLRIANACASKHNLALQAKQATCHAARCNLLVAQEEPVAMSTMSTLVEDCERNVANKGQTSYT